MKILVIRPDRIGDVILSTPVFEAIKRQFPGSHLTVFVRKNVCPLVDGLSSVNRVISFDPEGRGRHAGFRGFFRLIVEFRRGRFQTAVVLQSHWKVAWALFFAGIPNRVGPWSKFYSFITFNRGVRQHRSLVEMHEADYNLQLLRTLGIHVHSRMLESRVYIPPLMREQAMQWLVSQGWKSSDLQPLIAIHPGMGGSALNWPQDHYQDLVIALAREGYSILVTASGNELGLLRGVRERLGELRERVYLYDGSHGGGISFLGALFSWAELIVAPSTGPLHLAVALGKRVVTFFSPIRVQSAIRWGPYVSEDSCASVLVPEVYCGQNFRCRLQLCNYYPCMKSITVSDAMSQIKIQLERGRQSRVETKAPFIKSEVVNGQEQKA